MKGWKRIVRWVGVLPVAIFSVMAAHVLFLFPVFFLFNDYFECFIKSRNYLCGPSPSLNGVLHFIDDAQGAALGTFLATWTAPSHRKNTFFILSVLWLLVLLVGFVNVVRAGGPILHPTSAIQNAGTLSGIAGAWFFLRRLDLLVPKGAPSDKTEGGL